MIFSSNKKIHIFWIINDNKSFLAGITFKFVSTLLSQKIQLSWHVPV